jgi:hypothetical protein
MEERTFQPGDKSFVAQDSPGGRYSAVFEDDGDTGYFYAVGLSRTDNTILDAVHIYNVSSVADRDRPSKLLIVWSDDGLKCALMINDYAHAAFDFAARRGYCRTNFPNFPKKDDKCWAQSEHAWSDSAITWL